MKRLTPNRLPLAAALLTIMSSQAFAQQQAVPATTTPAPVVVPSDQVLAPLINYMAMYKYELKRGSTLYHWFQSNDPVIQKKFGAVFSGNLSSTDPVGLTYVQGMSRRYFNYSDPSDPGAGNMFGPGLYAAIDPVATRSYGGNGTDWVLTEIHIPEGFTIFDLNRDGQDSPPAEDKIFDALKSAGCPADWETSTGVMNDIFNPATRKDPTCTATIEHILRDKLHVDGFFYQYSFTNFKTCQPTPAASPNYSYAQTNYRSGAFVITDGSKFKASDIHMFNQNTTDDQQERIDIESLFYQADKESNNTSYYTPTLTTAVLYAQYPQYQGWTISYQSLGCAGNGNPCPPYIVNMSICPPAVTTPVVATPGTTVPTTPLACTNVQVVPPPSPTTGTISKASPPTSGAVYCASGTSCSSLLWNDLDGKPTDPNLDSYMKSNLYSCSVGKPDYL